MGYMDVGVTHAGGFLILDAVNKVKDLEIQVKLNFILAAQRAMVAMVVRGQSFRLSSALSEMQIFFVSASGVPALPKYSNLLILGTEPLKKE